MPLNNPYARRTRQDFSTIQPFRIDAPQIRPEEEEDTGIGNIIGQALGAGLGAFGKSQGDSKNIPAPIQDTLKKANEAQIGVSEVPLDKPQMANPYEAARDKYQAAVSAPIKKMKPWQDALYKAATLASNIFNPQNQLPIQGYGRAKHEQEVSRAFGEYAPLRKLEETRQADEYKQAQTDKAIADPILRQQELIRKSKADERRYEIQSMTLDWKKEDKERYRDLEDVKFEAKKNNDDRTYDLAVRKQQSIEANYKTVDENRDKDRESREKIAGMGQAGQNRRQQITIEAKERAAAVRAAEKAGDREAAQAGRERLKMLEQEYKTLNP